MTTEEIIRDAKSIRKIQGELTADLVAALAERVQKLERPSKESQFKEYVHKRLDEAGVPYDPNPTKTTQTGCRIGNRLDWLISIWKNS